jgi:DNA-binding MarR family transcriptional regulator
VWRIVGSASECQLSAARNAVKEVLRKHGKPLSAKQIADGTGGKYEATRKLLLKMWEEGLIEREPYKNSGFLYKSAL